MSVEVAISDSGALARVTLAAGKGNVLTAAVLDRLHAVLLELHGAPELRALVVTAAGPHFSFGASVEEHLPPKVDEMLLRFGEVVRALVRFPVPVAAAVRGRCLGGGLEVVLPATRIFAARDALFGQPEVRLGVLAPAACALLPDRVGRLRGEELLATGRVIPADEANALHLVDELADDPLARAEAWAREHLLPLSPEALRRVHQAVRADWAEHVCAQLATFEALYRKEVLPSADAREGLTAFLEKRAPRWTRG